MTQSPILALHPSKISLVQHYMECADSLPLDVQRCLTELREYDVQHRIKIEQVALCIKNYTNEKSGPAKKRYLDRIQRLLIKSQLIGDEKLCIISRIVDLVENRTQSVTKFANELNAPVSIKEDDFKASFPLTPKVSKLDKTKVGTPTEKSLKLTYDKPKRSRRVRASEKDKSVNRYNFPKDEDSRFSATKDEDMEEEEEEETEDIDNDNEADNKSKRDLLFRKKETGGKSKHRDEKCDRKEEKRSDKKEKSLCKVNKKPTKNANKTKKRKKKTLTNLDELAIDPDEPTYCICNSISYGDMIGCDNEDCEIEWFHFGCVNLSHKPKGKWYCPGCTAERRELKNKK